MVPKLETPPTPRSVAQELRRRIKAGDYTDGEWLPAERDLADEFGVHRRVVRSAITLLADEGRLVCRPRCRPLVASDNTDSVREDLSVISAPATAGSRLVALVMWHGGFEPRASAQQRIFWGFNRALSRADYHGVFLDLGDTISSEDENAAREAARLHYALEQKFAGVVFYPYAYRRNRGLIRDVARQMPLVLIDRQIPGVETDYVGIDNLSAMQEATRHLLSQGHRRIALVTRSEPINTVQDRITGYRMAMRDADPDTGTAMDHVITVDSALEWSMFDLIFRQPAMARPTALLCVNDFIALRAADRLSGLGLRIPDDVALVGFDDLVQTLRRDVGLSSVAQPFEEIGSTAARLLVERIAEPVLHTRHVELPAVLTARASSMSSALRIRSGADLVIAET